MNFLRLISFRVYISEDTANASHLFWEYGDGILVGSLFADARETEQPLWRSGCCPGLISIFKEAPWGSKIQDVMCHQHSEGTFHADKKQAGPLLCLVFA